jgi:hypothetical protein
VQVKAGVEEAVVKVNEAALVAVQVPAATVSARLGVTVV